MDEEADPFAPQDEKRQSTRKASIPVADIKDMFESGKIVDEEPDPFSPKEEKRQSTRKASIPVADIKDAFESGKNMNSKVEKQDNRRQSIRQGQKSVRDLKDEHEQLSSRGSSRDGSREPSLASAADVGTDLDEIRCLKIAGQEGEERKQSAADEAKTNALANVLGIAAPGSLDSDKEEADEEEDAPIQSVSPFQRRPPPQTDPVKETDNPDNDADNDDIDTVDNTEEREEKEEEKKEDQNEMIEDQLSAPSSKQQTPCAASAFSSPTPTSASKPPRFAPAPTRAAPSTLQQQHTPQTSNVGNSSSRRSSYGSMTACTKNSMVEKKEYKPKTYAFGHVTDKTETVEYKSLYKSSGSGSSKEKRSKASSSSSKETELPFSRASASTKASAHHNHAYRITTPKSMQGFKDFDLMPVPRTSQRVAASPHLAQPRSVQKKLRGAVPPPKLYEDSPSPNHTVPLCLQSATPGGVTEQRANEKGWTDVSRLHTIPTPPLSPTMPEFILRAASRDNYSPVTFASEANYNKGRHSPGFDNVEERRNRRDNWVSLKPSHDTFGMPPPPPNAPEFVLRAASHDHDDISQFSVNSIHSTTSPPPRHPGIHSPAVDNIEERGKRKDSWTSTKPSHDAFPEAPPLHNAASKSYDERDSPSGRSHSSSARHSPSVDNIEERGKRRDTWTTKATGEFPELSPSSNAPEFVKQAFSKSHSYDEQHEDEKNKRLISYSPSLDTIEERRNRKDSWTPLKSDSPVQPRTKYTPPASVSMSLSRSRSASRDEADKASHGSARKSGVGSGAGASSGRSPSVPGKAPPPLPSELAAHHHNHNMRRDLVPDIMNDEVDTQSQVFSDISSTKALERPTSPDIKA